MAGLPTYTDADGTNGVDTNYVTRAQGLTSQNWSGPAMAENGTSLGNSTSVVPAGSPNPEDAPGRPGYLAAGQPQGANVVIIPNTDGNGAAGATLQTVGANAGTAGGGGYYPNVGTAAHQVPNPMVASGWTIQNLGGSDINDDAPDITVQAQSVYTFLHTAGGTITPTITGGTSPYTVTLVDYVLNGANQTLAMPTGITLTAASGVLTISNSTSVAGNYQFGFKVTDSSSPALVVTYGVNVILT